MKPYIVEWKRWPWGTWTYYRSFDDPTTAEEMAKIIRAARRFPWYVRVRYRMENPGRMA